MFALCTAVTYREITVRTAFPPYLLSSVEDSVLVGEACDAFNLVIRHDLEFSNTRVSLVDGLSDLDTLHNARNRFVLESRVLALRILADEDDVESL